MLFHNKRNQLCAVEFLEKESGLKKEMNEIDAGRSLRVGCFPVKEEHLIIMPDHIHLLIWPKKYEHMVSEVLHSVKGKTGRQYKEHLIVNTPDILDNFCIQYKGKKKFRFWQPGGGYYRNFWNDKPIHYTIN